MRNNVASFIMILCGILSLSKPVDCGESRVKCIESVRKEYMDSLVSIVEDKKTFLIDSVYHWNLGDSFIEHGERILLKQVGNHSNIYCTLHGCNLTRLQLAVSEDPKHSVILVHGGGNFGDIWYQFRSFHQEILRIFKEVQIVFLPQTVHYLARRNARKDASKFARHPNVTVFVRDKPSLKYMSRFFPQTRSLLCPDGAFMIGPLNGTACHPKYDILIISRKDKEKQRGKVGKISQALSTLRANNVTLKVADWPCYYYLKKRLPKNPLLHAAFKTMMGRKCLCSGRVIITDRLHGTIMATLLGLPYVYLDNNYGKIAGFREAFFSPRPECSDENLNSAMATSWEEAAELAVGLLTRSALHQEVV